MARGRVLSDPPPSCLGTFAEKPVEQKWNKGNCQKEVLDNKALKNLKLRPFKALVVGSSPTQPTF